MTIEEASKTYGIPMRVLKEYERWELCGEAKRSISAWRDDKTDIERLGLILTLYDAGFSGEEVERYMRLLVFDADSASERISMLQKKRDGILDEIHFKQKQLDRLDYLRFEIEKGRKSR